MSGPAVLTRVQRRVRVLDLYRRCLRSAARCPDGNQAAFMRAVTRQRFRAAARSTDAGTVDHLLKEGEAELATMDYYHKVREEKAAAAAAFNDAPAVASAGPEAAGVVPPAAPLSVAPAPSATATPLPPSTAPSSPRPRAAKAKGPQTPTADAPAPKAPRGGSRSAAGGSAGGTRAPAPPPAAGPSSASTSFLPAEELLETASQRLESATRVLDAATNTATSPSPSPALLEASARLRLVSLRVELAAQAIATGYSFAHTSLVEAQREVDGAARLLVRAKGLELLGATTRAAAGAALASASASTPSRTPRGRSAAAGAGRRSGSATVTPPDPLVSAASELSDFTSALGRLTEHLAQYRSVTGNETAGGADRRKGARQSALGGGSLDGAGLGEGEGEGEEEGAVPSQRSSSRPAAERKGRRVGGPTARLA
jgi:hypothetical protein